MASGLAASSVSLSSQSTRVKRLTSSSDASVSIDVSAHQERSISGWPVGRGRSPENSKPLTKEPRHSHVRSTSTLSPCTFSITSRASFTHERNCLDPLDLRASVILLQRSRVWIKTSYCCCLLQTSTHLFPSHTSYPQPYNPGHLGISSSCRLAIRGISRPQTTLSSTLPFSPSTTKMTNEKLQNKKANLLFNKEKRSAVIADAKAKPAYLNQRSLLTHFIFGPYVLLPIISSLVWLGGLLALIGLWTSQGKPKYRGDEASVVFVSDGELRIGRRRESCSIADFDLSNSFLLPRSSRW